MPSPPKLLSFPFQSPPRPLHLLLDFDGTITTADTTAFLAETARDTNPAKRQALLSLWKNCLSRYASALELHQRNQLLPDKRCSLKDEISFQRSLRPIEAASVARVGTSGVLRGLNSEQWRRGGWELGMTGRVKVREGWRGCVEKVEKEGGRWGVVSVNWSADFVKGFLDLGLGAEGRAEGVMVMANRVEGESGLVVGPEWGALGRTESLDGVEGSETVRNQWLIITSDSKVAAMKHMRDSLKAATHVPDRYSPPNEVRSMNNNPGQEPLVVYVGDSLTDLECLLEAEVGIVVSADGRSNLLEALARFGLSIPHISTWTPREGKSLLYAKDFCEISHSQLFEDYL